MSRPSITQIGLLVLVVVFVGAAATAAPPLCDDGNPCTDDSGNPTDGCVHVYNNLPCNDGNACTTDDACSGGSCVGGTPVFCVAPSACYVPGTCDPISGVCSDAQPIPDGGACAGNTCTIAGTCSGGVCQGARQRCDDSDGCTDDSCNPSTGACTNTPKNCDDGNLCTQDYCSVAYCYHSPTCTDTDPCTNDNCNPSTGACTHTPNTGNLCGDDGDGNFCTSNRCSAGVCQPSSLSTCDDLNPCTADDCNLNRPIHCIHISLAGSACNDNNPCTVVDTCYDLPQPTCVGVWSPAICNDNDPCTIDTCVPSSGCVHQTNLGPCDDGNSCTANDTCSAGVCAGVPINAPGEVTNVFWGSQVTLMWDSVGAGTQILIASGSVSTLPAGGSGALCFGGDTDFANDPLPNPAVGQTRWYLLRAGNSCGVGTWGFAASNGVPTTPRHPTGTTCP
jgi:hypothetical protein